MRAITNPAWRLGAVLALAVLTPSAQAADVSLGPFSLSCDGSSAQGSALFITGGEPRAVVDWTGRHFELPLTRSASGACYAKTNAAGGTVFWNKGDDAFFDIPPETHLECHLNPPG
jgi:membrane-bound inhibitor of C-type lysozyme